MTKYAHFESTAPAPQPVLGWYDTDEFVYPNLPAAADLLAMTDAQWNARMSQLWSVNNGQLVAYVPPAPTLAQQAQAALGAGCQIVSTASPDLNGTYACDPAAQSKIQATALYIQVNGKFPAGRASLPWADISGATHTFKTTAEFLAFATAVGDTVTEIEMVILGESGALPAQPVTIA